MNMNYPQQDLHREITPLAPEDSFLVFDPVKDEFDFPIHFHSEYELNFIYLNKMSLNEIPKLVNMSPVSFNRFIKKRTGKTFSEYVNDTRIDYAARWLIEKDLSIAGIAYMCGFYNIANFNRVFKKCKNCTPSQYHEEFSGIKRVL